MGSEARGDYTYIYDAKRLIGKNFRDREVQELLPTFDFNVTEGENGSCMVDIPSVCQYSPQQIIADILQSMRMIVEMHFRRKLPKLKAVITIPANFDDI